MMWHDLEVRVLVNMFCYIRLQVLYDIVDIVRPCLCNVASSGCILRSCYLRTVIEQQGPGQSSDTEATGLSYEQTLLSEQCLEPSCTCAETRWPESMRVGGDEGALSVTWQSRATMQVCRHNIDAK